MLRFAIGRLLWALPTLVGISIVVFLLTTLIPDSPAFDEAQSDPPGSNDFRNVDALDEARRLRFLDFPRFFNPTPSDVRTHADALLGRLVVGGDDTALVSHRLLRLGGAALPYVLREFEALDPIARERVALALTPLAKRMGVATDAELRDPSSAVRFWSEFWLDRLLDFTDASVRRTVVRILQHGTDLRERELILVDTFALPQIIAALPKARGDSLERLTRVAAHVTGRGTIIHPTDDSITRAQAIEDWRGWWYAHHDQFRTFRGIDRIFGSLTETRYGIWAARMANGQLGISARDGQPVLAKLKACAPVTLVLTSLATLLSFAFAIPLGILSAWRRRQAIDWTLAAILLVLHSLPTFLIAQFMTAWWPTDGALHHRFAASVFTLALGPVALLARQQRAAILEVQRHDYIRTARAKGASPFGVLIHHALRNALLPMVTLAALQLPILLGGTMIVEEIFNLPGLGLETLRAVEAQDASWLVPCVLFAALMTTVGLIASDLAQGILDPRVRDRFSDDEVLES